MRIHVPAVSGQKFTAEDMADIVTAVGRNIRIMALRDTGTNSVSVRLSAARGDVQAVLAELFTRYPNARVTTAVARYIGAEQFKAAAR